MLNEVVLKLLVGVVDTKLLEPVRREDLEAEDVEDSDEGRAALLELLEVLPVRVPDSAVDPPHNPCEELSVDPLSDPVSGVGCRRHVPGHVDDRARRRADRLRGEDPLQRLVLDLKSVGAERDVRSSAVCYAARPALALLLEHDVPHQRDPFEEPPHLQTLLLAHPQCAHGVVGERERLCVVNAVDLLRPPVRKVLQVPWIEHCLVAAVRVARVGAPLVSTELVEHAVPSLPFDVLHHSRLLQQVARH
mmetsp:Transcript_26519/g.64061  ORF Transcript_26519/g.64061 Transcript_26519/m.64061 type:complete len:248 (+) Transcript_26519:702-1445(+)